MSVTITGARDDSTQSPAARHVAEKIRQAMYRGGVNQISAFGRKRITVVLDLEAAETFVGEMEAEEESWSKSGSLPT
jgi:hypothetical protein